MALMNQYAQISAQFPPLQTNPPLSTPTNATDAAAEAEKPTVSEKSEPEKPDKEEKTSVAANITDDDGAGPSTSSIETLDIDGNIVTIEDIGRNDPSDPNDPASEVRRRRLQRFEAKSQEES